MNLQPLEPGCEYTIGYTYRYAVEQIETRARAQEYLELLVAHAVVTYGQTHAEARAIQRSNISYVAGYYGSEEMAKVQRLYGAEHPLRAAMGQKAAAAEEVPE